MKRKLAVGMAMLCLVCQPVQTWAGVKTLDDWNISIFGQKLQSSAVDIDGTLYVPLRESFELINGEVFWYPEMKDAGTYEQLLPKESDYTFSTQFPLVASFPQAGIYVYGAKPDGMVIVEQDNEKTGYVKVPYGLAYETLPKMRYGEYNGDGKRDFSVAVLTEQAPNVEKESLYLLQQTEEGWGSTRLSNEALLAAANEAVKSSFADGKLTVSVGETKTDVPLDTEAQAEFGRVIRFFITKSYLEAQIPVFAVTKENQIGEEIGLLRGEIAFDGTNFTFANWRFTTLEEETENQALTKTALALMQRDLDVEGVFNAGLDGDWAQQVQVGSWRYAPVISDRFQTMADLEQFVRGTYSNEARCNEFLSRLTGEDAYVVELNGKLYVNADIGGKGMALQLDEESLRVKLLSPTQAEITFDFDLFDYDTLPSKLTMTKVDGTWLLDTGVYHVAQLAD